MLYYLLILMNKGHIWVEKYRPKTMSKVVGQDETVDIINSMLENNNLQHSILYGPPGTGKTTIAHNICRYFFCKTDDPIKLDKILKNRVLELNASNDRGINVARQTIRSFINIKVEKINDLPDFKIIILDEADALTQDLQFALRMIMDENIKTTRFILTCNYVKKIISPLISRCSVFRFKKISLNSTKTVIKNIGKQEGFYISDDFINEIVEITKGDLRTVINLLETVYYIDKKMEIETLYKISNKIPEEYLDEIFNVVKTSKNVKDLVNVAKNFINTSYSSIQLLNYITNKIAVEITENNVDIFNQISKTDSCINTNSDEYLFLLNIFMKINKKYN